MKSQYTLQDFQKMLENFAQSSGQEYFANTYQLRYQVMGEGMDRFITTELLYNCPCCGQLSKGVFNVFLSEDKIQKIL